VFQYERIGKQQKACVEELGGDIYAATVWIEDLEGTSLAHLGGNIMNFISQTAKMDSDYYPEGLRKVFIVNTPRIFHIIWKVAVHFFDEHQKSKLTFFGIGEDYNTPLFKVVAPEFVPKKYGGELDWAPPSGGDIKKLGLEIPKLEKRKWITAHVPRGGFHEQELKIEEDSVGGTLVWEFKTSKYDVGFSVLHAPKSDVERKEVVEYLRVDSDLSEVHGVYVIAETGLHVLRWDNSYSWVNGKDLKYLITLTTSTTTTHITEKGTTIKQTKEGKDKDGKEKDKKDKDGKDKDGKDKK